jgi:hypothetical protein
MQIFIFTMTFTMSEYPVEKYSITMLGYHKMK